MKQISNDKLRDMLILGGENLNEHVETINALNVFPVPDGDTGSNMNMTIQSGVKAIANINAQKPDELTKAFSKGLLLGARGNSGVILSQFFRGFNEGMEKADDITVKTFSNSLKKGKERAYASVIKAVEGTILTVIKDMSELEYSGSDFIEYFELLLERGQKSLENTPNLLPVLKDAGVVDSGGAGLLEVFKGMYSSLTGQKIKQTLGNNFDTFVKTEEHPLDVNDIIYGYCTEMLINLEKEIDINEVRSKLEEFGDSIVAVQDDNILKVHVHTEDPQGVFAYGRSMGDFIHIKSENMRIQAIEASGQRPQVENGIVVVCSSKKMAELFADIQSIEPIIGGQTLNPSTEDIVKSIKKANAKNVIVLPNNSNVIMAAKSAKDLVEGVNIEIIETKHMTQGFEALINYDESLPINENVSNINEALKNLVNYEVTNAIKDTTINEIEIRNGDYLIIKEGDIVASVSKEKEIFEFIKVDLDLNEIEVLSFFIGEDGSREVVSDFCEEFEESYVFLETKIYLTKQPVYHYLISALKE